MVGRQPVYKTNGFMARRPNRIDVVRPLSKPVGVVFFAGKTFLVNCINWPATTTGLRTLLQGTYFVGDVITVD